VDGSIAEGPRRTGSAPLNVVVGLAIVGVMLGVFVLSNDHRYNFYNHFVWQASAWLDGQAGIRYPVPNAGDGHPYNDFFQDVLPLVDASGASTGRALLPFPPLPALVLLPFVAVFGLATNAQFIAAVLGALDVGLAFWMLGVLGVRRSVRVATTIFFGLGTVFWYTSELGTTWYLAHVVAVGLTFGAIGLAVGGDRPAAEEALGPDDEPGDDPTDQEASGAYEPESGVLHRRWTFIDGRQFLAGLLFGLACTARLTVVFGAPFFILVGSGGTWRRRALSAGLGASLPLVAFVAYNVVSSGHVFSPVYDFLYHQEAGFYTSLGYHPDWSIEDPRYIPQNGWLMLAGPPELFPQAKPAVFNDGELVCTTPDAVRGLFNEACPLLLPRQVGMGLLLTSPAYLLLLPTLRRWGRERLASGALLAVGAIAFVNVMHFSQGWVQFGYRFSNDFVPFALLLVALGMERLGGVRWFAVGLIAISIAVNEWGVYWGGVLGW
jgi:hypothetical protein